MKEIKRDHISISYQVAGTGNTTLLFVHGSYINQTYWAAQVAYFSLRYTVVTLDLPGHGLSGKNRKNWSTKNFAEDVRTVIEELSLRNVILIAHSWGSDVCLMVATTYPQLITGFISIDYYKSAATLSVPQEQIDSVKESLKKNFAATNESYVRMALITPQTPASVTNRVVADYRNAYEPMGQQLMPEVFDMYRMQQKLLPELQYKLYLINVDYMPTNEELLKKYCVHGYELLYLNGTSHFPMIETPQELNKKLEQVIGKILEDE